MKILLVHNRYQQRGGEDAVFEAESQLLRQNGQEVRTLEFSNASIKSFVVKLKMTYQTFYNFSAALKLEKQILEFQPDVIHVHNFFYMASPSIFFVAAKHKIPVVMTLHNYRLICAGALLLRDSLPCELCVQHTFPVYGVKYACFGDSVLKSAQLTLMTGLHKTLGTFKNKVSKYIALTEFARQKILNSSLQLAENQIVVKPNSVEDAGFTGPETRKDFFLFIGRLSEEKGIRVLLKAFENQAIGEALQLEIIGEGEPEMNEIVRTFSHKNTNVTFHGFQKKDFILEKLKSCTALVFPSVWYEGLPMTILEAFSTGTPVIASNQENINQIVMHQKTGLLFETGNPERLKQTLLHFLAEKQNLKSLYANARNEYLGNYTPKKNYKNLMKIYDSAINSQQEVAVGK